MREFWRQNLHRHLAFQFGIRSPVTSPTTAGAKTTRLELLDAAAAFLLNWGSRASFYVNRLRTRKRELRNKQSRALCPDYAPSTPMC
jgi:hypothetical protein